MTAMVILSCGTVCFVPRLAAVAQVLATLQSVAGSAAAAASLEPVW